MAEEDEAARLAELSRLAALAEAARLAALAEEARLAAEALAAQQAAAAEAAAKARAEETDVPLINSGICFPGKTPIVTDQGIINIEDLTEKNSIRNNKIVCITRTTSRDKYLVCFEKDSLCKNVPSERTIMSECHCVYWNGRMIPAKECLSILGSDKVKRVKNKGEVLYNVLLETHEKMIVNNMICETLHPDNGVAKLHRDLKSMSKEDQCKLIEAFNDYVIKNDLFVSKSSNKRLK